MSLYQHRRRAPGNGDLLRTTLTSQTNIYLLSLSTTLRDLSAEVSFSHCRTRSKAWCCPSSLSTYLDRIYSRSVKPIKSLAAASCKPLLLRPAERDQHLTGLCRHPQILLLSLENKIKPVTSELLRYSKLRSHPLFCIVESLRALHYSYIILLSECRSREPTCVHIQYKFRNHNLSFH